MSWDGGWGTSWGSSWGGDWKRKRDSQDSKWKSDERKCKQCRKWESDGEWFGRTFYCARCCAKVAEQSHKDDYHEDAGPGGEPWLAAYKEKWKDLVEMEWREDRANVMPGAHSTPQEMRVVDDRLRNWPVARLVGQGFCITEMEARKRGTFFGKAKIAFSKAMLPRHQFSSGDEVIVSRGHPLDEKAAGECGQSVKLEVRRNSGARHESDHHRLRQAALGADKRTLENRPRFRAPAIRKMVLNEEGSLLQKREPAEPHEAWKPLDASQNAAALQAVEAPLSLIQGPPGTGKTTTTCHLVRRLVEKHCQDQLHATQHFRKVMKGNVAVDQLLAGLIRLGVKALRIGFPSKVSQELRAHTLLAPAEADRSKLLGCFGLYGA
eukprot:s3178_g5.t1